MVRCMNQRQRSVGAEVKVSTARKGAGVICDGRGKQPAQWHKGIQFLISALHALGSKTDRVKDEKATDLSSASVDDDAVSNVVIAKPEECTKKLCLRCRMNQFSLKGLLNSGLYHSMKLLHCHKHEELNAYSIYTGLHMFPRPGMSRKMVHIIMKLRRWGCLLIVDAPVQKTKDLVKLTCGRLKYYKKAIVLSSELERHQEEVKIVTDEKATNLPLPLSVIVDYLTKLEACARKLPPGFGVNPIQFERFAFEKPTARDDV
ncbi:hypothetical protein C4D60_Mb05t31070 [Musa balbisiana]|uniref:Uncharacterized protein n=1 Tax=Musa balbisiana TaxID=52838 RepID=A0A4S8K074_MUSBA|nr:hypothetical protein C4D60_Mb05t31070 [Musa balbisiana]